MPRFDWTRWAFYLAVGPPFLLMLFLLPSRRIKATILLFMLVFVEAVLLTWRPIGYIGFSLSGAMAYVIIVSQLGQPEARGRMVALGFPWMLFFTCAVIGTLIGSTSPISSGLTNWLYLQEFYLEGILFFWVGRMAFSDSADAEKLLQWLVYFGAGAAVLHFFSLATGYTFYATIAGEGPESWRYGGVFANPNSLAAFYAIALPAALICRMGWSRPNQRTGLLILVAAALMVGSLALTGSRGGSLVTIAMLGFAVALLPINLRSSIGWMFFAAFVLGIAYFTVTHTVEGGLNLTIERFRGRGLQDARYEIWAKTLQSIVRHPFGIGLDPYIYGSTLRLGVNTAHNIYLELASQIGILGLFAFLWIVGSSLRAVWRARRSRSPQARTATTALFIGLVGFLLAGFAEPIFNSGIKFQRIFWLLLGMGSAAPLWAGLQRRVTEEEPAQADAEPAFPAHRPSWS